MTSQTLSSGATRQRVSVLVLSLTLTTTAATATEKTRTHLLLPFVTNQAGFDTAITVSNTSQDPIGTIPTAGTCNLRYYGNSSPVQQTSPIMAAGTHLEFTLSAGGSGLVATPGFQGYIVISCEFPFAEAYVVVSDLGLLRLAQGYRAAVLADKKTKPGNTVLLFPFVLNQTGLDTGIVITNTTLDPQRTDAVSGKCRLHYYGRTSGGGPAPLAQESADIPAGQQLIFTLSVGGTHNIAATPGFKGYIVAVCGFPAAPGFALVSDLAFQRLAHGYLASELSDERR